MAEIWQVFKNSEKVFIWLYRENITMTDLAKRLGYTKQAVSQKIKRDGFSDTDITQLKQMGCPL